MIAPDTQLDKQGAVIFANQVKNAIQSNLMDDAQEIIKRYIQSHQRFNRTYIQTICDGKVRFATSNDDWLFNYIDAPTDVIVNEFKILWTAFEKSIDQQLEIEKRRWKNILNEFFNCINFIASSLENEGSSVYFIDDIFEASSGCAADNLKNIGQCMVSLLYTYLSGNRIQAGTSYPVFDKKYILKPKALKLFEKLPLLSPQLTALIKGMKDPDGSNDNGLAISSIKNFHVFLRSIMNVQSEVETAYQKMPATFAAFDKDQIYDHLLDKARGCSSKCPCCRRPCDVDHSLVKSNPGDEYNRHACRTGHQLWAMAGIKLEVSGEASLYHCEQVKDNTLIIMHGTKKKWSEFKKDHSDWDFGNYITLEELFQLRAKFLHVWCKIGQRLCQKYKMKFVTVNTPQSSSSTPIIQ